MKRLESLDRLISVENDLLVMNYEKVRKVNKDIGYNDLYYSNIFMTNTSYRKPRNLTINQKIDSLLRLRLVNQLNLDKEKLKEVLLEEQIKREINRILKEER